MTMTMTKPNHRTLLQMLTYRRPEGCKTQDDFCRKYLKPVFGLPDIHGNYSLTIGDKPAVMLTAHHDTVHRDDGIQLVKYQNGMASLPKRSKSNCLGADCTTGIWLMLHMIQNAIPGFYVIFAGEEIGCIGSSAMALENPVQLDSVKACVSFDRRNVDSIVTHQCGYRTASDEFAESLANAIGMDMKPDKTGAYTDSNEFAAIIPECTNLSVGYYGQHTAGEKQDVWFAVKLANALVSADWDSLVIARNPESFVSDYGQSDWPDMAGTETLDRMAALIESNPEAIACLLDQLGYSLADLAEEIGFGDNNAICARYSDIFADG